ncbi:hypothetical protein [Janthinobacterium psychrotolerans]|uniref:Iron transporter n=1 Tax=Janthinobacterium psychrotolerans TaxID=1747903 RepID=A0A1A7C6U4_9BURK|nr:hypothetical protein [Janthinobacterium psychrotolerans]OBV40038.1 hypothetical protein ASR47_101394 [Janthinobacterium psychrotolerans]
MSKPVKGQLPAAYRWRIASRVLAAALGGYGLSALLSSALALLLPRISSASRADAVLVASLLSFVVYTVVVLWVFHARSARRAWVALALWAFVCTLVIWLLQAGGA